MKSNYGFTAKIYDPIFYCLDISDSMLEIAKKSDSPNPEKVLIPAKVGMKEFSIP